MAAHPSSRLAAMTLRSWSAWRSRAASSWLGGAVLGGFGGFWGVLGPRGVLGGFGGVLGGFGGFGGFWGVLGGFGGLGFWPSGLLSKGLGGGGGGRVLGFGVGC